MPAETFIPLMREEVAGKIARSKTDFRSKRNISRLSFATFTPASQVGVDCCHVAPLAGVTFVRHAVFVSTVAYPLKGRDYGTTNVVESPVKLWR